MAEKELKARLVQKNDVEENWIKAVNFIPKKGEIIVYNPDASHNFIRFKIGDGESTVSQLAFANTFKLDEDGNLYM